MKAFYQTDCYIFCTNQNALFPLVSYQDYNFAQVLKNLFEFNFQF